MKILAWNCRGCKNGPTVRQLRSLINTHNPDICFLSETKATIDHMNLINRSLDFHHVFSIPAHNLAGGLSLLWHKDISLHIIASSKHNIETSIFHNPTKSQLRVTFFYGSPKHQLKQKSWDTLHTHKASPPIPWLIIGDLNLILHHSEKRGGRNFDPREVSFAADFLHNEGMLDLGFTGNPFTWNNGRTDSAHIKQRIDKGLGTSNWLALFPDTIIQHLDFLESDHCPILMNTNPSIHHGPKSFRVQAMWTKHIDFYNILNKSWIPSRNNNPTVSLSANLKSTKQNLTHWNTHTFRNLYRNKDNIMKQIAYLQTLNPSKNTASKLKDLHHNLHQVLDYEELFWKQKSRDRWIREGDRNTAYFHATICRRKRNRIESLSDSQGIWHYNNRSISSLLVDHFQNILNPPPQDQPLTYHFPHNLFSPVINENIKFHLCKQPSIEEIRQTMFGIEALKAPGPDGYPSLFYQTTWDTTGSEITRMVQHFFTQPHDLSFINQTNLTLIPKMINPATPEDYRPISLCNVQYKVISKILANRLKHQLTKFISPNQGANVENRKISDNTIIAHEIIHSMRIKRRRKFDKPMMAVKIDMSKAFDRIKWVSLIHALTQLGFNHHWISMINHCISSVRFSILLNGVPILPFQASQGLRQGDPLSPYLFITCMEILSRLITKKEEEGKIHGYQVSQSSPPISHLLFADDIFIFCRATLAEAHQLIDTLKQFSDITGQVVNYKNQLVYLAKTSLPSTKK